MMLNFVKANEADLVNIANAVRVLSMDAILAAKSGHTGLPLGGADIGTILYFAAMRHDPQYPTWINRDRFVLSAGHGSMLQYALLHLAGYDVSLDDLRAFRQWGSHTPGHPEFGHTPGIEVTTGPLGQGLATAVGIALAERMAAARFNDDNDKIIDSFTYVVAGDGCLMEGITSEASSFAGHLKLSRLIAFYDDNRITIDGGTEISFSEDVRQRYLSYGWQVFAADGHNFFSLASALDAAHQCASDANAGPSLIITRTTPGRGSPKWEGKHKIHGNPMSADDVADAKRHLGFPDQPFVIPDSVRAIAKALATLRARERQQWNQQFDKVSTLWTKTSDARLDLWKTLLAEESHQTLRIPDKLWTEQNKPVPTRSAGGEALRALAAQNSRLIGGSADLAGSTLTDIPETSFLERGAFAGRNIHFGIREHAMAAITNGLSLYGNFQPFCATFAVFSDYLKPSLRLSALMKRPIIYIFTHDSIGVGEDGPTHQPIEHIASLRAVPNLNVFRPADATETFAAWEIAVNDRVRPTALFLSRQNLPILLIDSHRTIDFVRQGVLQGGYVIEDIDFASATGATFTRRIVLVASGSEVALAREAAKCLKKRMPDVQLRVVSAPAPQQLVRNPDLLESLIPSNSLAVAIEAGATWGWGAIVGRQGLIIGLDRFGASAPADKLFSELGFDPEAIATRIIEHDQRVLI